MSAQTVKLGAEGFLVVNREWRAREDDTDYGGVIVGELVVGNNFAILAELAHTTAYELRSLRTEVENDYFFLHTMGIGFDFTAKLLIFRHISSPPVIFLPGWSMFVKQWRMSLSFCTFAFYFAKFFMDKTYKDIKLFLTDVDGTLTDGGMYYTAAGDTMKKFNTRDGMGLQLLQKAGVKVGILTSEDTEIVSRRAAKLGVDFLVQGKRFGGKLEAAEAICGSMGISLAEMAYMGDDVNCEPLLRAVGFAACPADAMPQVLAIPGIRVMTLKGGDGCVREFINEILPQL